MMIDSGSDHPTSILSYIISWVCMVFGAVSLDTLSIIIGMIIAVLTLVLNLWYKKRSLAMYEKYLKNLQEAKLRELALTEQDNSIEEYQAKSRVQSDGH